MAKNVENDVLLTIAIPTYNRAAYLDLCLRQIFNQVKRYESLVEVIISDNCSADNTAEIVQNYEREGLVFRYIRNDENLGADGNFAQCFTLATGKYVLLFGDDDILLDGAIDRIIAVLKSGEYGLVYLNSYGFTDDYHLEIPQKRKTGTIVFTDHLTFVEKVNYWITFASGNIVNKSLFSCQLNPAEFIGTHLVQLNWVLTSMFAAKENAVIEDYIVAFRSANTGGYQLCQVFGVNINRIFDIFVARGISRKYFDVINSKLLRTFFPNLILIQRKQTGGFSFEVEDYLKTLKTVYCKYPSFWLVIVLVIKLPFRLAKMWAMLIARLAG